MPIDRKSNEPMSNEPKPNDESEAGNDPTLAPGTGSFSNDEATRVSELKQVMQEFVDQRQWQKFHNAKNLSMSLAIEAGELMEHFQWLTTDEVVQGHGYDIAEVSDELADVVCYALSISNALHIDLSDAIRRKMIKNRGKYPPENSQRTGDTQQPPPDDSTT